MISSRPCIDTLSWAKEDRTLNCTGFIHVKPFLFFLRQHSDVATLVYASCCCCCCWYSALLLLLLLIFDRSPEQNKRRKSAERYYYSVSCSFFDAPRVDNKIFIASLFCFLLRGSAHAKNSTFVETTERFLVACFNQPMWFSSSCGTLLVSYLVSLRPVQSTWVILMLITYFATCSSNG